MASDPENDLEQAFHDTADAEAAALGSNSVARKVLTLVATVIVVIAAGVAVGYAFYSSVR